MAAAFAAAVACTHLPGSTPPWLLDARGRAETSRGLAFSRPPPVRLVDGTGLARELEAELERLAPPARLAALERAGAALGFWPPETDVRRTLLGLFGDVTAGFYSVATGAVVVRAPGRGAQPTAAERSVLVHELVHALQAQHSPLPALLPHLWDENDLGFALTALLEGDALRAELADAGGAAGPPPASVIAAWFDADALAAAHPAVPRMLRDPMAVQYAAGYAWVQAAAAGAAGRGAPSGEARAPAHGVRLHEGALGDVLASPPLSSEQLLHPERVSASGAPEAPWRIALPEPLDPPGPGCRELQRDTAGELGLRLWLREGGIPAARAVAAAAGWGGDRWVAFACPDGDAWAWWIVMDSEADARELAGEAAVRLRTLAPSHLRGTSRLSREGRALVLSAGVSAAWIEAARQATQLSRPETLAALLAESPRLQRRLPRATRAALLAGAPVKRGGAPLP